jgi:branched-chain amino acid aminotransferase
MKFDEKSYCYLNGKIVKMKDAKISPFDLGFTRGYAVTEVLRAYNGKIFLFDEH